MRRAFLRYFFTAVGLLFKMMKALGVVGEVPQFVGSETG